MYALPVSMPPSSHILVPMIRSHGLGARRRWLPIPSIAFMIDSCEPEVGIVCERASRRVSSPRLSMLS